MVSIPDGSLSCWSFYVYLLFGGVGVTYGLRIIVDRLFGSNLDKWLFLRATILAVGLYIFVIETRHGLLSFSNLKEDVCMSMMFIY